MAALKNGGIPNLAPLAEHSPTPAEPPVEAPPAAPVPIKIQTPPPPLPPAPVPAKIKTPPPPPPAPIPEPEPEPEPLPKPEPPLPVVPPEAPVKPTPLQTYESDFTDRMKETRASAITVLAAEQDAGSTAPAPTPQDAPHGGRYILIGVVLLLLGGAGVYVAYTRYLANSGPVIIAPTVSAPIFVDEREQVSGTGSVLLQAIERSVARPLASGSVRFLYLMNATTTENNSVFLALNLPAPDILLRNVNAGGMAGVINEGGTQSPFFILSVASYRDTFAGMLSWEPTMPNDLAALFPPLPLSDASTTAATTTAAASVPGAQQKFRDEVIANHDVRVYRSALGKSVLLYGYWNQTTLIIARDTAAFTEIVQRLATSRAQ